jgi:hypothetical protein
MSRSILTIKIQSSGVKSMLRLGIILLVISVLLSLGVVWEGARGVYILAGDWGVGFGNFCLYFIWGIFVVGLAFTLFGNVVRIMRKERD